MLLTVSAGSCLCVCFCVWWIVFVRPPGGPHLIVHPQLIAVWISERNASCPNSKSMSLIFQLDLVLYRNLSKRDCEGPLGEGQWPLLTLCLEKLIFGGYSIDWKLVCVKISKTSGTFKYKSLLKYPYNDEFTVNRRVWCSDLNSFCHIVISLVSNDASKMLWKTFLWVKKVVITLRVSQGASCSSASPK